MFPITMAILTCVFHVGVYIFVVILAPMNLERKKKFPARAKVLGLLAAFCPRLVELTSCSRASSSWLIILNEQNCQLGSLTKCNKPIQIEPSHTNELRAFCPALLVGFICLVCRHYAHSLSQMLENGKIILVALISSQFSVWGH